MYFTLCQAVLYFIVLYCSRFKIEMRYETLLIFAYILLLYQSQENLYRLKYVFFSRSLLFQHFDIVFPHNLCISKWVRTYIYILSIYNSFSLYSLHFVCRSNIECVCMRERVCVRACKRASERTRSKLETSI